MKKVSYLLLILGLCFTTHLAKAQAPETFPTDLTVMAMQDLMKLDPKALEGLPVYDIDGKLLSSEKAMELSMSGDFIPDYYANAEGKPVAQKMRKPTEQERAMLKSFFDEKKRMDALIGTPAKNFETVDIKGNPVNLADMKGSIVAVNFWFIGCKPCIQEMPELNEIVSEHKDDNVKFVAIALDAKTALEKFATKKQFDYNVVPDGKSIARLYDISGYPTHCIIDQEGNIAYFQTGYSPQTAEDIKKTLEKLLHK